jgi:rhamnogalacturonyl hydrolase YesR
MKSSCSLLKSPRNTLVGGFNHLENYESQFWKDDIPYMTWKITKKMFETTNQFSSSPLTNIINHYYP